MLTSREVEILALLAQRKAIDTGEIVEFATVGPEGMAGFPPFIDHTRGQITIVDRKGLEAASCACYRLIKDEYDRLLSAA